MKRRKILYSIVGISFIFTVVFTYEFLFGKLFAFSPLIIGFAKHELPHTIIHVQKAASYDGFRRLDTLVPAVEKFHEMTFTHKPEIIVFADSLAFISRSFSKARFSAYPSGRLLVSPWAVREDREGNISLEMYVRHELSHVLLMQHMSYLETYRYPAWVMEGIAMYGAHQMGTSFYPGKDETYRAIADGNFLPPLDYKTKNEDKVTLKVKYPIAFTYSEFACIMDYLIATYGKDKMFLFMKKLMGNGNNDLVFMEVYHVAFPEVIRNFMKHVTEHSKR